MSNVSTAGVVLAAGAGRRYGRPKALVSYDGELLVDRAANTLRAGGCDEVLVVLGAAAEQVRTQAHLTEANVVVNDDWSTGMGSTLRLALSTLATTSHDAAVILLVDTPGVTADAVRRMGQLATAATLAAATYRGRRGHPVVIGRDHWAGVRALAVGDVGARPYLAHHADQVREIACDDVSDDTDLDTPADHAPE